VASGTHRGKEARLGVSIMVLRLILTAFRMSPFVVSQPTKVRFDVAV